MSRGCSWKPAIPSFSAGGWGGDSFPDSHPLCRGGGVLLSLGRGDRQRQAQSPTYPASKWLGGYGIHHKARCPGHLPGSSLAAGGRGCASKPARPGRGRAGACGPSRATSSLILDASQGSVGARSLRFCSCLGAGVRGQVAPQWPWEAQAQGTPGKGAAGLCSKRRKGPVASAEAVGGCQGLRLQEALGCPRACQFQSPQPGPGRVGPLIPFPAKQRAEVEGGGALAPQSPRHVGTIPGRGQAGSP